MSPRGVVNSTVGEITGTRVLVESESPNGNRIVYCIPTTIIIARRVGSCFDLLGYTGAVRHLVWRRLADVVSIDTPPVLGWMGVCLFFDEALVVGFRGTLLVRSIRALFMTTGLEDAELLLWALQCIVDFAAAVSSLVDDEFGTSDTTLVVPR